MKYVVKLVHSDTNLLTDIFHKEIGKWLDPLPTYNAISQKWFLSAMQSLKYMSLFHISASRSLYFPCVHNEYTKYIAWNSFFVCLKCLFLSTTTMLIVDHFRNLLGKFSFTWSQLWKKNDSRHDIFCVLYFLIEKKIHTCTSVSIHYCQSSNVLLEYSFILWSFLDLKLEKDLIIK